MDTPARLPVLAAAVVVPAAPGIWVCAAGAAAGLDRVLPLREGTFRVELRAVCTLVATSRRFEVGPVMVLPDTTPGGRFCSRLCLQAPEPPAKQSSRVGQRGYVMATLNVNGTQHKFKVAQFVQ
jgi:hypothetical protein